MTKVIRFRQRPCDACRAHRHWSCWQKLADLFDDEDEPCVCACWTGKETTIAATADSMHHHSREMARIMKLRTGGLFMCSIDPSRSGPRR